jgi:hypothetical protein
MLYRRTNVHRRLSTTTGGDVNGSTFRNEVEAFLRVPTRAARAFFSEFDRTKVVAALDALNQLLAAIISDLAFWAAPPTVEVAASMDEIILSAQPIVGNYAGLQVTLAGQFFDQTVMFLSHGTASQAWRYWSRADRYTLVSSWGTNVSVSFPVEVEIVIIATGGSLGAKTVVTTPPTAPVTFPLQKL